MCNLVDSSRGEVVIISTSLESVGPHWVGSEIILKVEQIEGEGIRVTSAASKGLGGLAFFNIRVIGVVRGKDNSGDPVGPCLLIGIISISVLSDIDTDSLVLIEGLKESILDNTSSPNMLLSVTDEAEGEDVEHLFNFVDGHLKNSRGRDCS